MASVFVELPNEKEERTHEENAMQTDRDVLPGPASRRAGSARRQQAGSIAAGPDEAKRYETR